MSSRKQNKIATNNVLANRLWKTSFSEKQHDTGNASSKAYHRKRGIARDEIFFTQELVELPERKLTSTAMAAAMFSGGLRPTSSAKKKHRESNKGVSLRQQEPRDGNDRARDRRQR